ncbi:MAG: hypothetical protein CMM54_08840 [Rhodospirillaceae bacterium]|nr:hypothetical protein [Rhodospirillaceae bacterium]
MNEACQAVPPAFERFGGELPAGCDVLLQRPTAPDPKILLFSHGRAALAWFLEAFGPFNCALVCAYTCPTVPAFFRRRGLAVTRFDYGETDLSSLAKRAEGRALVLLPAPFGIAPWLDAGALAGALGERFAVVVDAAQSAFGHLDFAPPAGGAVLSCPRKALAIGDGAALRLGKVPHGEHSAIKALPLAGEAVRLKRAARELFALKDPDRETEALGLVEKSEKALPDHACRITERSRDLLMRTDRAHHMRCRSANAAALDSELSELECLLPPGPGTPFAWPFAARDRGALLSRLRERRVFATPLWPNAVPRDSAHLRACRMSDALVALPVDQRYSPGDMRRMAELVRACL